MNTMCRGASFWIALICFVAFLLTIVIYYRKQQLEGAFHAILNNKVSCRPCENSCHLVYEKTVCKKGNMSLSRKEILKELPKFLNVYAKKPSANHMGK